MGKIENLHVYPETTSKEALIASLIQPVTADNGSLKTLHSKLVQDLGEYIFWCVHHVVWPLEDKAITWISSYILHQIEENDWGFTTEVELNSPKSFSCPMEFLQIAPVYNQEWRKGVYRYHADEILKKLLLNKLN